MLREIVTRILIAGLALAALPPRAGAEGAGAGDPAPARSPRPPPAVIRLRPRTVYVKGLVTASIVTRAKLPAGAMVRWTASGGLLHYDDLPEIRWRAPDHPGRQRLDVSATIHGRTVSASLEFDVKEPSLDGMVWIPPGKFLCGDVVGTRDTTEVKTVQNDNDEPFHDMYLDGYWIDRYPVTNEQFVKFLQAGMKEGFLRLEPDAVMGEFDGEWVPYYYFGSYVNILVDFLQSRNARRPFFLHIISWDGKKFHIKKGHEKHPVADVTWFGATTYVRYYGKELPTEAQWEKAARGTDGRLYPWGNNLPTRYHAPSGPRLDLAAVGSFSPQGDSPYGVCDMLSGCFEWTSDWFNVDYYEDFLGPDAHRNPTGTYWGRSHAIRGFPNALLFSVNSSQRPAPVSVRYEWIFDHMLGDCFGNRQSTFRGAVSPTLATSSASRTTARPPITTAEAAARAHAESSPPSSPPASARPDAPLPPSGQTRRPGQ